MGVWRLAWMAFVAGYLPRKIWGWAKSAGKHAAIIAAALSVLALSAAVAVSSLPMMGALAYSACSLAGLCHADPFAIVASGPLSPIDWGAPDALLLGKSQALAWGELAKGADAASVPIYLDGPQKARWLDAVDHAKEQLSESSRKESDELAAKRMSIFLGALAQGSDPSAAAEELRERAPGPALAPAAHALDGLGAALASSKAWSPGRWDILRALNTWSIWFGGDEVADPAGAVLRESLEWEFGALGLLAAVVAIFAVAMAMSGLRGAAKAIEEGRVEMEAAVELSQIEKASAMGPPGPGSKRL